MSNISQMAANLQNCEHCPAKIEVHIHTVATYVDMGQDPILNNDNATAIQCSKKYSIGPSMHGMHV